MMINSVHPDCLLKFYVFDKDDTFFASRNGMSQEQIVNSKVLAVRDEIISVNTTKGKGAAGNFSIVLASSKNWLSVISPGSWVAIYIKSETISIKVTNELDSGLKMLGIVKSIRKVESLDYGTGTKIVRYLISGQDFQSVFHSPIYLNAAFSSSVTASGALAFAATLQASAQGKTPDKVVEIFANGLLGSSKTVDAKTNKLNVYAGQTRGLQSHIIPSRLRADFLKENSYTASNLFMDLITMFLQGNLIGFIGNPQIPSGTIDTWSIMKAYSHSILNEMYTDLLPVKIKNIPVLAPSMTLRAIPFSSEYAKKKIHPSAISMHEANEFSLGDTAQIPTRTGNVAKKSVPIKKGKKFDTKLNNGAHFFTSKVITEDEILGFSCGRSDDARFNMFVVYPDSSDTEAQKFNYIETLLQKEILRKGGDFTDKTSVGRYGSKPFITSTLYARSSVQDLMKMNEIVRDLYFRAHLFENGQIQIIGSNYHIPVGTNVKLAERITNPKKNKASTIAHVEQVSHDFNVQARGQKSFITTISFINMQKEIPAEFKIQGQSFKFPDPVNTTDKENVDGQAFDSDRGVSEMYTNDEFEKYYINQDTLSRPEPSSKIKGAVNE